MASSNAMHKYSHRAEDVLVDADQQQVLGHHRRQIPTANCQRTDGQICIGHNEANRLIMTKMKWELHRETGREGRGGEGEHE
jgi:hypothetical protein